MSVLGKSQLGTLWDER